MTSDTWYWFIISLNKLSLHNSFLWFSSKWKTESLIFCWIFLIFLFRLSSSFFGVTSLLLWFWFSLFYFLGFLFIDNFFCLFSLISSFNIFYCFIFHSFKFLIFFCWFGWGIDTNSRCLCFCIWCFFRWWSWFFCISFFLFRFCFSISLFIFFLVFFLIFFLIFLFIFFFATFFLLFGIFSISLFDHFADICNFLQISNDFIQWIVGSLG